MNKNKTSKYLKYAIGEIVLVMIGILLAFQVNEWNNNRQVSSKEQQFLKNLQADIKNNLIEYNRVSKNCSGAYSATNKLLEIIKSDDPIVNNREVDSLMNSIINKFSSLDVIEGSINEIINTGSLNVIKDPELRKQLSNWSQVMNDYKDDVKITFDYLFNNFIPSIENKILLRNVPIPESIIKPTGLEYISKSNFELDYNKTLKTIEFENKLAFNALNYVFTLESYRTTENYFIELLSLIENNIND
jgi:type II secretory pathway pseudopilin PulG